jgi:tripartite-type tricarboxylate transporter receptor subunit TctC
VATLLPYIKSGQVRPIVLLSDNRTDILPTVSTVVEEGYKNMVMPDYWVGLAAPPNTSIKIIDQLNHSVNTSMNNLKVKSYMKERGLMLKSMTPSESTKQITQEIDYWREFVKKNNIKIE